MEKVGFAMTLIGLGGLAEGYGDVQQIVISIVLIAIGAGLMRKFYEKDGTTHADNSNVLGRLRFLP